MAAATRVEVDWWVPYVVEFCGTFLFQVLGGSTAVTMDAVYNGVGTPRTHTRTRAHSRSCKSLNSFCPCS